MTQFCWHILRRRGLMPGFTFKSPTSRRLKPKTPSVLDCSLVLPFGFAVLQCMPSVLPSPRIAKQEPHNRRASWVTLASVNLNRTGCFDHNYNHWLPYSLCIPLESPKPSAVSDITIPILQFRKQRPKAENYVQRQSANDRSLASGVRKWTQATPPP